MLARVAEWLLQRRWATLPTKRLQAESGLFTQSSGPCCALLLFCVNLTFFVLGSGAVPHISKVRSSHQGHGVTIGDRKSLCFVPPASVGRSGERRASRVTRRDEQSLSHTYFHPILACLCANLPTEIGLTHPHTRGACFILVAGSCSTSSRSAADRSAGP